METFAPARPLEENPGFEPKKARVLREIEVQSLDPEMRDLVAGFNALDHCYTLQCCHGHVMIPDQGPPEAWQGLAVEDPPPEKALYQLAYLALVVRNDPAGEKLVKELARLAETDPAFIQTGSPDWFWTTCGHVNSYAIQVSPEGFKHLDRFEMSRQEALGWMAARRGFMKGLEDILRAKPGGPAK